jgi:hypothetical protein
VPTNGQTQHGPEASSECAFQSAPAVGGVGVQGHEVYLAGVDALERSNAGRHSLVHTIQRRDRCVCAFRWGGGGVRWRDSGEKAEAAGVKNWA